MLYYSRLLNALGFVVLAALIVVQHDVDGEALVSGYHGLGLALLLAFAFALLNFRGAIAAAFDSTKGF